MDLKNARRASGFTLIEVLIVMAIIAFLGMIVMGSASFITKIARSKRNDTSKVVLQSALYCYHSEYNEWPGGYSGNEATHSFKTDNGQVFGMLRADSPHNPKKIAFLDETAFMTYSAEKKRMIPLSESSDPNPCIMYIDREGKRCYFSVEFDYENDTARVSL